MAPNFTLADLLSTSGAFGLLAFVVFIPGYVLGFATDVLSFRRRLTRTRCAVAIPLSIGICPIVTDLLWRISFSAVCFFYASCALIFPVLLIHHWRRERPLGENGWSGRSLTSFGIAAVWVFVTLLLLIDLQSDHRLYFPTVTYDYALRSAFVAAISQSGVPPHNPYFFPGRYFALQYHYFWLSLCGVAQKFSGGMVSSRQAMLAGTGWCGVGLLALIALYSRFFNSKGKRDVDRRTLIGVALLCVTGLDIVPVLLLEKAANTFLATIEWWNRDQVTAWVDAILWVPHHVAALIACLMGFLVIWIRSKAGRSSILPGMLAGLMFGSALGLSIYVTLVFSCFLLVWLGIAVVQNRRDEATRILIAGTVALLLAIPFSLELFAHHSSVPGSSGGTIPLRFAVRRFTVVDIALGINDAIGWQPNLVNLLCLPLSYFLELGFFFFVAVIKCKRLWQTRNNVHRSDLCGLVMLATSVLFCSFVRSTVIVGNDLGGRGLMIAQFVLLLWGAEILSERQLFFFRSEPTFNRDKRAVIVAALVLGIAGTVYDLVKLRFYPMISDATSIPLVNWLSSDRNLGARTFALRQLYEELKRRTPTNAVFQHNPDALPQDNWHGMYADRQLAAETPSCSIHFGGDAALCQSRIGRIQALFEQPQAFNASQIDQACRDLSIDVLVVKDTDKVWQDRDSWVWKRTPIAANDYGRAFACGSSKNFKLTAFSP